MSKILSKNNSIWFIWALFTSVSLTIGFIVSAGILIYVGIDFPQPIYQIVLPIVGLFMGFGQWIILRVRSKKHWVWIPATVLGLPLGFYFGSLTIYSFYDWKDFLTFSSLLVGMVAGLFQWFAISRKINGSLVWIVVSALSWGIAVYTSIAFDIAFGDYIPNVNNGLINGLLEIIITSVIIGVIGGVFIRYMPINFNEEHVLQNSAS